MLKENTIKAMEDEAKKELEKLSRRGKNAEVNSKKCRRASWMCYKLYRLYYARRKQIKNKKSY